MRKPLLRLSECLGNSTRGPARVGSKVDLARSQIGMVVRAGAKSPDIGTVDAFRLMLLNARSIAYSDSASGIYLSRTLFAKLGVADLGAWLDAHVTAALHRPALTAPT